MSELIELGNATVDKGKMDDLEDFWTTLLSGNAGLIRRVWSDLTDDEARAVVAHLKRMMEDEGYSEEQKQAAQKALEAIREAG